ncbi:MAG: YpdA family putative bacillithiol disulfide reductase [Saprospiraceae bacterium]|nr:YpdA family putative bacillithiol disulfide reductase [Saprospiraceae bacterium]
MLDLIIVGAGPMGITVGIEAQKAGLSYLIIDKGALVNSIYHFPTNMTFFSTSEKLEIGGVPFISHGDKPTRSEALEYFRRVIERWKLSISNYEAVTEIKRHTDHFEIKSAKTSYTSKSVVIATGFYGLPNLMDVKGEDSKKVKHYYDEAHPYLGKKVAVVGAANSACDVALELYHKGVDVTMIIRGTAISDRVKYWIRPNILNRIAEGSIMAYFESQVLEIRENELLIATPSGEKVIENDFLLAMTGYLPDYSLLEQAGIQFQDDAFRTPIYKESTHETNVRGLYLAGVVCGGRKTNKYFIENSKDHAEKIIGHLKGES